MSPRAATAAHAEFAAACFVVHARAEPGVMPRVLELFAKRGLIPSSWRSWTSGPAQGRLTIDIEMRALAGETAGYIAACMRQIASVETVEAGER